MTYLLNAGLSRLISDKQTRSIARYHPVKEHFRGLADTITVGIRRVNLLSQLTGLRDTLRFLNGGYFLSVDSRNALVRTNNTATT